MAIKKVVEISAKVGQAKKEIGELFDDLLAVEKQSKEVNTELEKAGDKGAKSMEGVSKATNKTSTAFKGLKTALIASGIGALVAVFGALISVLQSNQKVIDTTKAVWNGFTMAVNDGLKWIQKGIPQLKGFFNELGENPKKKLKELGTSFKDYLVRYLEKSLQATVLLGEAFKEFFNGNFGASWDKLSKSASTYFDAVTGVDDAYDKLTDKVEEYYDAGMKVVQLQNNAKLSKASLQGLVEMYDRLAEQQRQIRDDENKTIEERIQANNKLGEILKQQEKAQLSLANAIVASAQAELSLNNNIDNQVALIEARNEAEAVRAQVAGFMSEQLVNQVALEKELLEYNQLAIEGTNERRIIVDQLANTFEKDSIKRLENEKNTLVLEGELEEERLQQKVNALKKGTLAYQEAEQERLTFIEEQNLKIQEKENEIELSKEEREREILQRTIDNELISFEERYNALDAYNQNILNSTQLSEYEQTRLVDENTKKRIALTKAEKQAKLAMFDAISNAGNAMAQAVGEQTALGKSLAVASALISTYTGIANEIGTKTVTPYEIALKIANIATVAAVGFKSVKDILSVKVPNDKGGGGGGAPQAQPPAFNLVGQSGTNQLAQTISQQEQEPIKAYVVSKEMTTQQSLNRNIKDTASF